MKTITIPKSFGYPTTEIISNGKTYTLNSGVEITVEDHIAEIVENAIALAPKVGRYKSRLAQLIERSIQEITEDDFAGVSTIGNCAFYLNDVLKKVTIPNSITAIKDDAFGWAHNLTEVHLPEIPPDLETVEAFAGLKCTFYCKTQESLEAYKKAANWSTLTSTYSFVVENKNG